MKKPQQDASICDLEASMARLSTKPGSKKAPHRSENSTNEKLDHTPVKFSSSNRVYSDYQNPFIGNNEPKKLFTDIKKLSRYEAMYGPDSPFRIRGFIKTNSPVATKSQKKNVIDIIQKLCDEIPYFDDTDCKEINKMVKAKGEEFNFSLMLHQSKGLKFMLTREKAMKADGSFSSKINGGILADDMGLGKTIQSMALIATNTASLQSRNNFCCLASTLIVCPVALIHQWKQEISDKTKLNVLVFYGRQKSMDGIELNSFDVVITTYNTLVSLDHEKSILAEFFNLKWWRIILDEAHIIKNRHSKTSKVCFKIKAVNRWCLTGTPIQNSIDDIYPLLKFLRVSEFEDYAFWRDNISKPIQNSGSKSAFEKLQVLLKALMLRRRKVLDSKIESTEDISNSFIGLKRKFIHIEYLDFSIREQEFYSGLKKKAHSRLDKYFNRDDAENNEVLYSHALAELMKLRLACNHVSLAEKNTQNIDKVDDLLQQFSKIKVVNSGEIRETKNSALDSSDFSTKINKVIEIIEKCQDSKFIVFSQFTSMFDLLEKVLISHKIGFLRYDGSMTTNNRKKTLEKFQSKNQNVLICSLKCAALGLNLTVANSVILVDIWWNPALEDQAIDRVFRIGQTRDVHIYKLIIKNTIEEQILKLQAKKRQLHKDAIDGGKLPSKLSKDEIKLIFT